MKSRLTLALAAFAGAAATLTLHSSVQAYPDAKVEAQLRPDFGLLLRPPLHHHHYRPWGRGPHVITDEGPGDRPPHLNGDRPQGR